MSYNDRIDAACVLVAQHNEAVGGEERPGYLHSDPFFECIKASGGTSEERLKKLSHEDILACMPTPQAGPKPKVLAMEIAEVFRNKPQQEEKRPVSSLRVERMTYRELVEAFEPEDFNNAVSKRLLDISKDNKFIVYSDGRTVDVNSTLTLLNEIRGGYAGRENYEVNGSIKKVYKIGELPDNFADENPIYHGRPLRPDGSCDQLGRSWAGVDLRVRQFIYLAINSGELTISHEVAHSIMDIALQPAAFNMLRSRYRRTAIIFDASEKVGKLPVLKIALGGSESNRPFENGKKVAWR